MADVADATVDAKATPLETSSTPLDDKQATILETPTTPVAAPTEQPQQVSQQDPAQQQGSVQVKQPAGPQAAPAPAPAPTPVQHPAVQKAGLLHTIAETLAGGPRYKEKIDVNTGETIREKIPMSRADIGMAIAMSAIEGALAGLSAHGPNHKSEAGLRGFEATSARRQQVDQKLDAQAQADYARHAQITETNLRLYNNAQQAGRMGFEANSEYVGQSKPLADKLVTEYPQAVRGHATEQDLVKYHIAKDSAIPFQVVKRLDPKTGEQVTNNGVPQWDIDYLVVDPSFKSDDILSPDDIKLAQKYRLQGFTNGSGDAIKLPQSLPMQLSMAMNYKSQLGALTLAEHDLKDYYETLNARPQKLKFDMKAPSISDPTIEALVDDAATKYGVDPALARAVAIQESGGQQKAISKAGAIGVMQLMPDTAKGLGVDPHNAAQNIDGGVRYLKSMLDRFNGDPRLALAAYNAGPERVAQTNDVPNITETKDYVKSITSMIGLGNQKGEPDESQQKYEPVDLVKAVQNDPTLVNALVKFQAMFNRAGDYSQAIGELGKKDPQAAAKISGLYGGRSAINAYDQQRTLMNEQFKDRVKADEQLRKEAASRAQKEDEDRPIYMADAKAIAGDPNDPGSGDMVQLDKLISQRTKDRPKVLAMIKEINPNWNMADAQVKLDVWHDFTTDRGKASQQIKSANTLFDHIGGAIDASDRYRRSPDSPLLNKPLNWWNDNMANNPLLAQFRAAIEPVKTEFMTFLGNNHALTEHDKTTGDILLSDTMTPAKLEASLKQFAETAAYRLKETDQQWARIFRRHFPGMISEDALHAITKMTNADGSNNTADILKDMDTGGSVLGSSNGRGVPGKTVSEALGRNQQPVAFKVPDGAPSAQGLPDGKLLKSGGKTVAVAKGGQWIAPQL